VLPLAAPGNTSKSFSFTARSSSDPSKGRRRARQRQQPGEARPHVAAAELRPGTTYLMKIENQGNLPDQFQINTVLGSGAGPAGTCSTSTTSGAATTSPRRVKSGGGWKTRVLQPYESQEFRVVFSYTEPNAPSVQLTAHPWQHLHARDDHA
jgi:hypothetical protein